MWFTNILLRILASMFIQHYWSEVFFLPYVFIWFWGQDDVGFTERVWKSSILLYFLKQSEDGGWLSLKCSVEFSCETAWSRAFVCWEFFDDCFNFVCCYWSVQVFCFFFIQVWKILFLQKCVHFIQVFKFLSIQFFIVISYNLLYFCGISCNLSSFIFNCVYLDPFSFLLEST